MIPKGNQRSGGQQLATHLLNAVDNERIELAEVRGAIAQDLHGAFKEWQAIAKGTQCKKYLYSLSINPDHRQAEHTRDHYLDFISRTEKALGLTGQPRAVVFHIKNGREHCHAVWSRIDAEKLKAVHIAHDRQKLRKVAQEFARDHGLTLPEGMRQDRGKERFKEHEKDSQLAERQQEERTGISKEERRRVITEAWTKTRTGEEFVRELTARDYFIAKGDKRAYVVIDLYGEVHSLSRQIKGATSKDIKARMADYPLERLPDTLAAQDFARLRREEKLRLAAQTVRLTPEQRRERLTQAHSARRASLEALRQAMRDRQALERHDLLVRHKATRAAQKEQSERRQHKGFLGFLSKITGYSLYLSWKNRRQDSERRSLEQEELASLTRRHQREAKDFQRHERSLARVERREQRSLETKMRREEYEAARQAAAGVKIEAERKPQPAPAPKLTPELSHVARDTGKPPTQEKRTPLVAREFNEQARGEAAPDPVREGARDVSPFDRAPAEPKSQPHFSDAVTNSAAQEKADFARALKAAAIRKSREGPDPGRERTPGNGR